LFRTFILEFPVCSNKTKSHWGNGKSKLFWLDATVSIRSLSAQESHWLSTRAFLIMAPHGNWLQRFLCLFVPSIKYLLELHFCDYYLEAHKRILMIEHYPYCCLKGDNRDKWHRLLYHLWHNLWCNSFLKCEMYLKTKECLVDIDTA
jgi:hypothetical protein